jgi:glycosyltransferase involved in cell wall biosynthesis
MSRWAAESMVDELGHPEDRVRVVGGGATIPEHDGPRAIPEGPPEIVFIGRDWERKGGPLLVEAFQRVRRVLPDARLTIVGGDREVNAPGVKREGFLDRNEEPSRRRLEDCYRRATVMCLPSHFDPFGLALLESQIRGVPVLTFGAEGRTDAVIDGVTGLLLWDRRPEALAEALLELLTNPARAQALGEQGRSWARSNATWEHVTRRCLGHMCEALAADRARAAGANGHGAVLETVAAGRPVETGAS